MSSVTVQLHSRVKRSPFLWIALDATGTPRHDFMGYTTTDATSITLIEEYRVVGRWLGLRANGMNRVASVALQQTANVASGRGGQQRRSLSQRAIERGRPPRRERKLMD